MGKQLLDLLQTKDYKTVAMASSNIGNNPSRADIEAILAENSIDLPAEDITFFLIDTNNHNMQVVYIKTLDTYFYTSMADAN